MALILAKKIFVCPWLWPWEKKFWLGLLDSKTAQIIETASYNRGDVLGKGQVKYYAQTSDVGGDWECRSFKFNSATLNFCQLLPCSQPYELCLISNQTDNLTTSTCLSRWYNSSAVAIGCQLLRPCQENKSGCHQHKNVPLPMLLGDNSNVIILMLKNNWEI